MSNILILTKKSGFLSKKRSETGRFRYPCEKALDLSEQGEQK